MSPRFTPQDFQDKAGVSRETLERLKAYSALLEKWQKAINLVSDASLPDMWQRHFWDSAQLAPIIQQHAGREARCLDMGSGAGFPGLVLAAMGVGRWTLVEADARKVVFLREAVRVMEISATLHAGRLEDLEGVSSQIVTARAFAPLPRLLGYAHSFWTPGTLGVFLKGARLESEVRKARTDWQFDLEVRPSQSDPTGSVALIRNLAARD